MIIVTMKGNLREAIVEVKDIVEDSEAEVTVVVEEGFREVLGIPVDLLVIISVSSLRTLLSHGVKNNISWKIARVV